MRFPFVSRELYEYAAREAETWKAEYRALQYSIVNPAKVDTALTADIAQITPTPREKDPITERIEAVSEGDPKVARHFRKLATQLRKDGKSVGDILAEIKWTSTEPEQ